MNADAYGKPFVQQCKKPRNQLQPILVFTDASWDGANAGWGCVIIDQFDNTKIVAGGQISSRLTAHWISQVGDQIICEAELYAALLARIYIGKRCRNRRSIFWVDNDASRLCLIKTVSSSVPMLVMTQLFHMCLEDDNLACWMERVPSEANLADLPSRGQVKEAADIINGRAVDDSLTRHWYLKSLRTAFWMIARFCLRPIRQATKCSGVKRVACDPSQTVRCGYKPNQQS